MRYAGLTLFILSMAMLLPAQDTQDGPKNEKARKTYQEGLTYARQHRIEQALDDFKKADKQDDNHCLACQKLIVQYATDLRDWKTAEAAAREWAGQAQGNKDTAIAHYELGMVLLRQAVQKQKTEMFQRSHDEFSQALSAVANFPQAVFADGQALAFLKQDDAAKVQFEKFVKMKPEGDVDRQRAMRYLSQSELARARMAPPFAVTTLDGQRVSLDDLKGKVVLLDFWATWCGPCREALPHMKSIAKKFQGQPFVVLSVSLDQSEGTWKEFITKNEMTWLHYRDGGFEGRLSKLFGVEAIPQTFTIDADGVLQDEHIGDASMEGKLKKLIARAQELKAASSF